MPVLADEKILDSMISSVVVYPDGGAVTRQAEITLPAGEHTLYFQNLPNTLATDSVQVDVQATTASTILDITTKEQKKLTATNERLQALDKQIETLTNESQVLQDQLDILTAQQSTLTLMQQAMLTPNTNGVRPSLVELKNIMLFSKDELSANLEKRRLLEEQKLVVTEKLRQLAAERLPLSRQNFAVKNVAVRVNLEKAGSLKVNLTYVMPHITWSPRYDIRFDTHNNKLALTYLGRIQQATGEDWHNVKLTLSTARPSADTIIPVLRPWHLDERAVTAKLRQAVDMSAKVSGGTTFVVQPAPPVAQELTSASFNLNKPIALLSGTTSKFVDITTVNLPVSLSYVTVPKLSQAAYLQVNTVNQSDYPLLNGQTNIFMDNRFVSSGYLKTTMPNEKFSLDLGIDPSIAVAYKQVQKFTEQTGLTSSYTKTTYEYLLTIQNNKRVDEKIKVIDQIPVSQDEQITVKLLLPPVKTVDKEGKITEEWVLKAGEKKEQLLKYTVEYPKALRVLGL